MRRLIKDEKAQAMVEMALILPILVMLIFGITEFGRIFSAYMVINNLAREGVRYGVVGNNDSQIQTALIADRTWLDQSKMNITITPSYSSRVKGGSLQVAVNYQVNLITPVFSSILPNPVPITAQCAMRVE